MSNISHPAEITARCAWREAAEAAHAAWCARQPIYASVVSDLRTLLGVSTGANRLSSEDRQRIANAVQRGVDSLPRLPVRHARCCCAAGGSPCGPCAHAVHDRCEGAVVAWETTATLRDPDGAEREVGVRTVLDRATGRVTHEIQQ
jgi:hypothetical protein